MGGSYFLFCLSGILNIYVALTGRASSCGCGKESVVACDPSTIIAILSVEISCIIYFH